MNDVTDGIRDYLTSGGLFNPELMDHQRVRDLVIEEQRDEIERLRDFIATLARDYERALDTAKQESTRLLAEIDRRGEEEGRLRELLRQSLIHYPFNNPAEAAAFNEAKRLWGKRVREALGE